jgi:type IV pilus assembly protein PilV
MRRLTTPARGRGFSLVEVMVALIIICVGLLGIAKLEALMLSSTGTSRLRALVALQAESLADMMHADRDYWDGSSTAYWNPANNALALTATETSGATPTWVGTNAPGSSPTSCANAVCNSEQLAQYDLYNWGSNLTNVLQNSVSTVGCNSDVGTGLVSCTITIQWNENTVAANSQEANAGGTAFQQQTYTLVVEP